MILPKKPIFSKYQNKAEAKVLSSNFQGFKTWAASLTSTASATAMTSSTVPLHPYFNNPCFNKELPDPEGWVIPGNKMTNNNEEWIIKN